MITFDKLQSAVRASKTDRDTAIRELAADTALFRKVKAMVISKGGTSEEATMVYSDTIVAFVKRVIRDKNLSITTALDHYIVGIARHKWYDLLKSRDTKIDTTDLADIDPPKQEADQFQLLRKTERWAILQRVLDRMAARCKKVLMLWAAGHNMKEIAAELTYKSEGMARKKKSECMKELMIYMTNNPKIKEELR